MSPAPQTSPAKSIAPTPPPPTRAPIETASPTAPASPTNGAAPSNGHAYPNGQVNGNGEVKGNGQVDGEGHANGNERPAGCTAPQLRRFIKSRPYVPMHELRRRFETLTERERAVMAGVVAGRLNKQIAGDLGTSEKTVKTHRSHVMHKMAAESVPDLVRMADRLKVSARVTRA